MFYIFYPESVNMKLWQIMFILSRYRECVLCRWRVVGGIIYVLKVQLVCRGSSILIVRYKHLIFRIAQTGSYLTYKI